MRRPAVLLTFFLVATRLDTERRSTVSLDAGLYAIAVAREESAGILSATYQFSPSSVLQ